MSARSSSRVAAEPAAVCPVAAGGGDLHLLVGADAVHMTHRAGLSWAHRVGWFGRPVVVSQPQGRSGGCRDVAISRLERSRQKAAGTGQQRRHPAELRSSPAPSN